MDYGLGREVRKLTDDVAGLKARLGRELQGRHMSAAAPSDADVFKWNDTTKKWEPEAPSTAVAHTLDSTHHTDVGAITEANGKVLYHNGSNWAAAAPAGDLGGTFPSVTVDATHSGSAHHAQAHAADHTDGTDDIQDAAADDSTKGIATFEADDFDDASGKIDLADSVAKSFPTGAGTATPSTHALTIAGGEGIYTTGAGSTVTVTATGIVGDLIWDDPGDIVIGLAAGAAVVLPAGVDGTVLTGTGAGSAPVYEAADAHAHVSQGSITTVGALASGSLAAGFTDVPVAQGGTGASTAQAAIDTLTAVAGATDEHVLTKDTASGNAIFKAAAGGGGVAAERLRWIDGMMGV